MRTTCRSSLCAYVFLALGVVSAPVTEIGGSNVNELVDIRRFAVEGGASDVVINATLDLAPNDKRAKLPSLPRPPTPPKPITPSKPPIDIPKPSASIPSVSLPAKPTVEPSPVSSKLVPSLSFLLPVNPSTRSQPIVRPTTTQSFIQTSQISDSPTPALPSTSVSRSFSFVFPFPSITNRPTPSPTTQVPVIPTTRSTLRSSSSSEPRPSATDGPDIPILPPFIPPVPPAVPPVVPPPVLPPPIIPPRPPIPPVRPTARPPPNPTQPTDRPGPTSQRPEPSVSSRTASPSSQASETISPTSTHTSSAFTSITSSTNSPPETSSSSASSQTDASSTFIPTTTPIPSSTSHPASSSVAVSSSSVLTTSEANTTPIPSITSSELPTPSVPGTSTLSATPTPDPTNDSCPIPSQGSSANSKGKRSCRVLELDGIVRGITEVSSQGNSAITYGVDGGWPDPSLRRDVPAIAKTPRRAGGFGDEPKWLARTDQLLAQGNFDGRQWIVFKGIPGKSRIDETSFFGTILLPKLLAGDVDGCRQELLPRVDSVVREAKRFVDEFGVLHKDLHPGNILWDSFANSPSLIDWGVAEEVDQWTPELEQRVKAGVTFAFLRGTESPCVAF